MSNWFKRNGIHFAIIGIFFVVCFIYFTPAFQGKVLGQSDVIGAQSTQTEINKYKESGETILWTNQIFGGMPAYQIWAPYANNITTHLISGIKTIFPDPIDIVLLLMTGSYFLFNVLRLRPWLAAAGALAFTFSSYNIIYIVAGHANQTFAIAFFAPIIAGIILTLRGKYLLGGSLTALFLAIEIRANHVQMTYYLMLALLVMVGVELYHAIKTKTLPNYLKSIGYLGAALILAIAVNASTLWSTYEYGKDSIRGKSNLAADVKAAGSGGDGLTRKYAYEWSQGVGECLTFLVPNIYGGGAGANLDENSATAKVFSGRGIPEADAVKYANGIASGGVAQGMGMYWGNKPFTEGPWYFGAAICFLFIFGLIVVRDRIKWWLLGAVILTMLLSFGANWPYVSDLFFNYFPLYNKFRAVESILSVTMLCFPILALLAVKEVIDNTDKTFLFNKLKLAFYITGGLTVVLIVMPNLLLSFRPETQTEGVGQLAQALQGDNNLANEVSNAIIKDRISLARVDAIRTLIFILAAFGLLWAFIKQKVNVTVLSLGMLAIFLVDLWQIDKRYLRDERFNDKPVSNKPPMREVDTFIARDTDPNFRVFDATANPIYDVTNPFFHKSFSGYSAARMKRIQEVIERQFARSVNHDVLDMMNVKYIITADPKTNNTSMSVNSTACGNAWFVKGVNFVKGGDQEMQEITTFSPKDEAVIDEQYKSLIDTTKIGVDANAYIKLTKYHPDHLEYQSSSSVGGIAVFSEVYYNKGWTMKIDGKEASYFRADYLLRAATIPVGNHTITFDFHPASYYTGEGISLAGSVILVLALGFAGYTENKKKPAATAEKKA